MKKSVKIILTFTVLATSWFIYWIFMFFIPGAREIPVISLLTSLLIAAGFGFLIWKRLGERKDNLSRYVLMGGLITGAVFFLARFVGPMIFWPSSNLGPMFGLFFTGPLGFLTGLLGGGTYWRIKVRKEIESQEN